MKVAAREVDGVVVAELAGEIDTIDTEGFQEGLSQISAGKPKGVVLDFAGVKYIASSGIAMAIKFIQEVRRGGGKVRLARVAPNVRMVLDMVNLRMLVSFDETVAEGVKQLKEPQPG